MPGFPRGEFTPDDIVAYLNQELPGFEPELIRSDGPFTSSTTLRVRARVAFASYATVEDRIIFQVAAGGGTNYELQRTVDEWIRKTRRELIEKMGLQKQIDDEVKQQLSREIARIRQEEFAKAYAAALREAAAGAAEAQGRLLENITALVTGKQPTEAFDPDDLTLDDL